MINNRVLFRNVAKIARAQNVGIDPEVAKRELTELFDDNRYSIEQAYANSVGVAYAERDLGTRIQTLLGLLDEVDAEELESDVREKLQELVVRVERFLRDAS